jgi:hypothetical protein
MPGWLSSAGKSDRKGMPLHGDITVGILIEIVGGLPQFLLVLVTSANRVVDTASAEFLHKTSQIVVRQTPVQIARG